MTLSEIAADPRAVAGKEFTAPGPGRRQGRYKFNPHGNLRIFHPDGYYTDYLNLSDLTRTDWHFIDEAPPSSGGEG